MEVMNNFRTEYLFSKKMSCWIFVTRNKAMRAILSAKYITSKGEERLRLSFIHSLTTGLSFVKGW